LVRTVAIRMLVSRQRRRITAAAGLRRLASRARVAELPPVEPDMDLVAALATLPVAHRAVVVLHHLYDLPVGEVAARLRIPVGTVKSRLSRARTALAPFLDDERSRT
jgi:RNA polymerase sigma-70 factor (ECF subfamily)